MAFHFLSNVSVRDNVHKILLNMSAGYRYNNRAKQEGVRRNQDMPAIKKKARRGKLGARDNLIFRAMAELWYGCSPGTYPVSRQKKYYPSASPCRRE